MEGGYVRFERGESPSPLLDIFFVVLVGDEEVLSGKMGIPPDLARDVVAAERYAESQIRERLDGKRILGEKKVLLRVFRFGEPSRN